MDVRWINRGKPYWPIDIAGVEKRKDAIYMGDFCLKYRADNWSEHPHAVFWNENPPDPSYSQYFGLSVYNGKIYITGAGSVAEGHWNGMVADDGEIVYSRYRHDFRSSTDGSVTVDGGRDYFKAMGAVGNPNVRICLVRDRLVVNEVLFLPYEPPAA